MGGKDLRGAKWGLPRAADSIAPNSLSDELAPAIVNGEHLRVRSHEVEADG
jgi:hypothetical protein